MTPPHKEDWKQTLKTGFSYKDIPGDKRLIDATYDELVVFIESVEKAAYDSGYGQGKKFQHNPLETCDDSCSCRARGELHAGETIYDIEKAATLQERSRIVKLLEKERQSYEFDMGESALPEYKAGKELLDSLLSEITTEKI